MLCFRKFLVAEKFLDKEGGREKQLLKFSVENLLSQSAEKLRSETF